MIAPVYQMGLFDVLGQHRVHPCHKRARCVDCGNFESQAHRAAVQIGVADRGVAAAHQNGLLVHDAGLIAINLNAGLAGRIRMCSLPGVLWWGVR